MKAHHCQLPATPCVRTMSVTRFGVSLLKVVATMLSPASHHGTLRLAAKNAVVLFFARRLNSSDGAKQITISAPMISQSRGVRWTKRHLR